MKDSRVLAERVINLIEMDETIRDYSDEELMERWYVEGVPDGATDEVSIGILLSIAEDEKGYQNICDVFDILSNEAEEELSD